MVVVVIVAGTGLRYPVFFNVGSVVGIAEREPMGFAEHVLIIDSTIRIYPKSLTVIDRVDCRLVQDTRRYNGQGKRIDRT